MKASVYKKLASAKQVIEELTLPSGVGTFKMRTAPIPQWVATGVLPASLTAKMQELAKKSDPNAANDYVVQHFTEKDFADQQGLGKRLLEYCCIEPKVVVSREPVGEEIAPEDILPEDFEVIMKWIWSGGRQGETLEKFRKQAG